MLLCMILVISFVDLNKEFRNHKYVFYDLRLVWFATRVFCYVIRFWD